MSNEAVGRKIANFTFVSEIGEGGMGKVYLARQDRLDRMVAIKILHANLAEDEVFVQRFHREAKAAAVFQHPNVVAVIDAGEDSETGDHYIAFEYIEGAALEDVVVNEVLPERKSLEIIQAIAEALSYANSKKIVHRDVKPDNILLANDGTPKLADLGLAKTADPNAPQVTQAGMIVGTPLYMAPEQALGYEEVDIRADIYSLGLVLWRMLSGQIPFDDDGDSSSLHVLSRHINEDLPDVRGYARNVSEEVAKIIHWMAARDREDRYRKPRAIVDDIQRVLDGEQPLGPRGDGSLPLAAQEAARDAAVAAPAKRPPPPRPKRPTGPGKRPSSRNEAATSSPMWTPPSDIGETRSVISTPVLGLVVLLLLGGLGLIFAAKYKPAETAEALDPTKTEAKTEAKTDDGGKTDDGVKTDGAPKTGAPDVGKTEAKTEDAPPARRPGDIDLEDKRTLTLFVEQTAKILMTDLALGKERVNKLEGTPGAKRDAALRRFIEASRLMLNLVDPSMPEIAFKASMAGLRNLASAQPIPGEVAQSIDNLLADWIRVGDALRGLRLSLTDPRQVQRTVADLKRGLSPEHPFRQQALALIELAEIVDFHRIHLRLGKQSVATFRRQKWLQRHLEGDTALNSALGKEVKVLNQLISLMLRDRQRSMLDAIERLGAAGRRSPFLRSRRRDVPTNASMSRLRATGLRIVLGGELRKGQKLRIKVDHGPTLEFDQNGLAGSGRAVWARRPVILIEPHSHHVVVRLPNSTLPREGQRGYRIKLDRPRTRGLHRLTVRPVKLSLKRVTLLYLPQRDTKPAAYER